jgi:hypothetical protein
MTEISTHHESLRIRSARATRAVRAGAVVTQADGGVLHRYGPHVEIRRAQPIDIGGQPFAAAPARRAAAPRLTSTEKLGADAFALRQSSRYRAAKARRPRDGDPWDLRGCLPVPGDTPEHEALRPTLLPQVRPRGTARAGERGVRSAMLWGSVGVGIVIVNGPTAATRFSAAERVKLVAEVQAGLSWLGNLEPAAGVSWHYEINDVTISAGPNVRAASDEKRWRDPTMGALGYTQDWQGVLDFVAALRTRLGTRWAYCAFFVKGYPLWHFAYASAPRVVMDYANGNWGPDNIDRVFAHETGHIFSAADEYVSDKFECTCTSTHGIYDEPNSNCVTCAPFGAACLMKANDWVLCGHTRRHLGWALGRVRVPQGAAVHAVSRAANKLDIFFTDEDGRIMSAAWEPALPGWWEGFWHIRGGTAPSRAPVTAVSRSADKLDIFVVGNDKQVYTAAWRPDVGWEGWWPIPGVKVPTRSQVTAVSRSTDKLDIFVTDIDGRVMTAAWEPGFSDGWHGWWHIKGGRAAPGAMVGAAVRGTNKLDVFVVGSDGFIYTAAWAPASGDGWQGWWRIAGARFPEGAAITAVSRSANKLDIFACANGGETMTAAWEPAFTDGWHGWWHIKGGRANPGARVHAVSRAPNKLDVFVTNEHGFIYTAAWEPAFADGWHGWWQINGGRAVPSAHVIAVSRAANKLDAFVVGMDGRIYTAAWEPGFTEGWHGWYPMGT